MNDSILSMSKLPHIVIAGRPNVGKSTLFNRLIRKRRAITDPTPGVTRDPVEAVCRIQGKKCKIIDTGGFKLEKDVLDDLVISKAQEMIESADLILLLVDVMDFTPEDEIFIENLRPYNDRIVLVINKVDNEKRENSIGDFTGLGFKFIPISASHGINLDKLEEEIASRIEFTEEPENNEQISNISLAIIGKPNTGKSTLVNRLTDTQNSIVSEIPGTTRDIIEGNFSYRDITFKVVDTAGIRRKTRVSENIEYYSVNRAIKSIDESDCVFLLIDSMEGLSEQDKKIASLAVKKGVGIILVLNKWDMLDHKANQFEAMRDRIRFLFPVLSFAPVCPVSALTGEGIEKLLKTAIKVWKELNREISTPKLNKSLSEWQKQFEAPLSSNKKFRYKVRYITQVRINPVRFLMFVNKTKGFPQTYVQYIKNRLQKDFGFTNIPISIEVR